MSVIRTACQADFHRWWLEHGQRCQATHDAAWAIFRAGWWACEDREPELTIDGHPAPSTRKS